MLVPIHLYTMLPPSNALSIPAPTLRMWVTPAALRAGREEAASWEPRNRPGRIWPNWKRVRALRDHVEYCAQVS